MTRREGSHCLPLGSPLEHLLKYWNISKLLFRLPLTPYCDYVHIGFNAYLYHF